MSIASMITLLGGCIVLSDKVDSADSADSAPPICGEPVEHPHDPTKPAWTYHGETNGQDQWGTLEGYGLCSTGTEQSPIDIADGATVPGERPLVFHNYEVDLPMELLDNGHTLQVNVDAAQLPASPQIEFGGVSYTLIQFHAHASSEHTLDGAGTLMELHFVHRSAEGALAVVGLMLDAGADNAAVGALLEHDPGPELEVSCEDSVSLAALVPTASGFYHYDGSLTTPDCAEDVSWFVLFEHGQASEAQADDWQSRFGGSTNRATQPLNARVVSRFGA